MSMLQSVAARTVAITSWPAYVACGGCEPGTTHSLMGTGFVLLLLRSETEANPEANPTMGYSTYPTRAAGWIQQRRQPEWWNSR